MRWFREKRPPDFGRRAMNLAAVTILAGFVVPILPEALGWVPGPGQANAPFELMAGLFAAGGFALFTMPIVLFGVYALHPSRPPLSSQAHNAVFVSAALWLLSTAMVATTETEPLRRVLIYVWIVGGVAAGARAFVTMNASPRGSNPPSVGTPVTVLLGALFLYASAASGAIMMAPKDYERARTRMVLYDVAAAQRSWYEAHGEFAESLDSLGLRSFDEPVSVGLSAGSSGWSAAAGTASPLAGCHVIGRVPADTSARWTTPLGCVQWELPGATSQLLAIMLGVPFALAVGAWHWAGRTQNVGDKVQSDR